MKARVAICFLLINRMEALPEISVTSAYARTGADIFLGYLNEADLPYLKNGIRVNRLLLERESDDYLIATGGNYSDFSEDSFYRIVQYKWKLLHNVLSLGYDYIIYSDTDVYWNVDPIAEIVANFELRPEVHIQIQSFTDLPSQPKLCMGFVALRNSAQTHDFIQECQNRHTTHSRELGKIGDDDIVTQFYVDKKFPSLILELPQTTFPVGRMLKLYSKKSMFPGLPSPVPFIFHANYVVGLRNKLILMKLFINHYSIADRNTKLEIKLFLVLLLQRLRYFFSRLKRFLAQ
jgi:hypothetical protein